MQNLEGTENLADQPVLVVGAGGIGCELLKDLLMTGFRKISIVDLDTIECSNLNRQFLFRSEHVGMSKAKVAALTALQYLPAFPETEACIQPYHASIFDSTFDIEFYKKFRLVIGGLDNAEARRHVNRMCLASGVPLVDCGTQGHVGQVRVIIKGKTECYQCVPQENRIQYASCTIRNTPSQPVHCIIWSKYLFSRLFGLSDPTEEVSPEVGVLPSRKEGEDAQSESYIDSILENWTAYLKVTIEEYARSVDYDIGRILHKLYVRDIEYLQQLECSVHNPPIPLDIEGLLTMADSNVLHWSSWMEREQKPWSTVQCVEVAKNSLGQLKKRRDELPADAFITWDKDDSVAVDFVTAFANLRSHVFGLPLLSRFDVASIAGQIIPAVASVNAVIAGLAVMKGVEVLRNDPLRISMVYLGFNDSGPLLNSCDVIPPNEQCLICSPLPRAVLKTDLSMLTVTELENILKKTFGIRPDVYCFKLPTALALISSVPGELEGLKSKTLQQCGVENGSRLAVDDAENNFQLEVSVLHCTDLPDCGYSLERYGGEVAQEEDVQPPAKRIRVDGE